LSAGCQQHKDERHPRKHSSADVGLRGVNQLVRGTYPAINREYRDLLEISMRTRYDVAKLEPDPYAKFVAMLDKIDEYAAMMHVTREPLPSERPLMRFTTARPLCGGSPAPERIPRN
jgi:hypothetical protein